jgi:hypothetical protein
LFLFLQHDNLEASKSSSAMAANFEHQGMFPKTVKRTDLDDKKLYLPSQFVQILNPVDGIQIVTVRDDQMRSYPMHLCKRQLERDRRTYLGRGWPQFFQEKGIRVGDTVTFSDLNWDDAARPSFKITHEAATARREPLPFDLNELPFDLNKPPPPEN